MKTKVNKFDRVMIKAIKRELPQLPMGCIKRIFEILKKTPVDSAIDIGYITPYPKLRCVMKFGGLVDWVKHAVMHAVDVINARHVDIKMLDDTLYTLNAGVMVTIPDDIGKHDIDDQLTTERVAAYTGGPFNVIDEDYGSLIDLEAARSVFLKLATILSEDFRHTVYMEVVSHADEETGSKTYYVIWHIPVVLTEITESPTTTVCRSVYTIGNFQDVMEFILKIIPHLDVNLREVQSLYTEASSFYISQVLTDEPDMSDDMDGYDDYDEPEIEDDEYDDDDDYDDDDEYDDIMDDDEEDDDIIAVDVLEDGVYENSDSETPSDND